MSMTTRVTLALLMTVSIAGVAAAQQDVSANTGGGHFTYIHFYRVHLRNGNCIDGDLVGRTDLQVTLRLSYGEIHIRRNMIDRIEFVKMKSWNEPAVIVFPKKKSETAPDAPAPKKTEDPAAAEGADSTEPVPSNIPQSAVEQVDLSISVWKRTPMTERPDLTESLTALGASVAPYLEFLLEKRAKSAPVEHVAKAMASLAEDRFLEISTRMVTSKNAALRNAAVAGLARTGSNRRIPILLDAMDDPDPAVWKQAAEALITWAKSDADKRDLAELLAARTRSAKNVMGLAMALSKLGGRAAHDALWDLVNSGSSENTRQIGLNAIGLLKDPEDGPRVQALLRDPSQTIRKAACLTIGKLKFAPACADLVNLLSEENPGLQKDARWALLEITGAIVPDTSEAWREWWTNFGSKEPKFNP